VVGSGFGAIKQTYRLFWAIPNFLLYPFALFLVYVLETFAKWT